MVIPRLLDFRADRATYVAGDVASISVSFDQVVNVDTFGGFRVPVLVLSNGARAYYSGGSGTDELRFQYNVSETDRSSLDLKVVAFAENDATIRNVAGEDADVTVRFNDVGSLSANNDILTPNELRGGEDGEFVTVQTQSLSTGADLVNPKIASMSSVSGTYGVGTTLDIVVSFDEVVLVRTAGGVPTLKFAGSGDVLEGFAASYVGGSGTKKLTFRVEIADGMPTASGLDVIDLSLNGGAITDLSGNSANLSIVAGTNNLAPYADIQVDGSSDAGGGGVTQPGGDGSSDVTAAVIESIQSIKGDGPFDVGERVDLRVTLSEAVTLNTLLGSPILALSNGGTAQYVSGSGTRELLFRYTVKASDRNTQDLNVIGVAENDALIVDAAGNRTDVRITADNQLAKFGNVVIDAQAPYLRSVDAADDTYIVGDSITFTGSFSEAVTVTGTPGLNLSNGGVARYVSGSGSSLLVFKYDVTDSSQSSADLDVVSLNVADGAFKSAVTGNAATVQVAPGILSFDADVLIDTSRPSGTISIDKTSLIANEVASVTVTFDEEVDDPRSAITVLNGTLSDLVGGAGDETGARSRVWTGTFTPALGIEDPTNALVLDNSKVFDDAGNPGIGLAASANFLIDTRGPVPVVSSVAQADGSRLLTVDFGEAVTDLSESGLVVENGVAGTFSKLSDSKYTLSVTPEASNPSGSIKLSLADNVIQDALGNYNDPFSASFVWDETAPVIERITSVAASYTTGQDIYIDVEFNEPVTVSPIHADAGSNPILALSNGQVAHYASGSGTTSLTFRYTVQRGDEASDLDSLALVENASRIHDISGNDAQVKITPGLNNLAFATNIVIDGVVPSITNVSADDGLYQAGDEVRLDVQFSEDVTLDRSGGDPILALSNGSYASFVSHDGDRMVFSYAVSTGDNDAQDLDVLGFAENGSAIADASGNRANVAIRFGMNNLAERNEVNIDAARPQIAETSANAGEYKAGQQIEIALAMSKGVVVDTTQGDPSLELNNGREAIFDAEKSTATTLWFVYDVLATDVREDTDTGTLYEEYDLSIKEFKYNNAEIRSLIGGADAQMTLPLSGLASEAVRIDLTLPEVVSISLSDTSLSAGEDADVTVVLSEPVRQLDVSYFSVPHGSLSAFTTTDNITWHAVYTPVRDVEADELVISLDASRLSDEAGNLGLGEAQSGSYSLDSTYPDLEIRSDASGVVHKGQEVRFTLQFSEAVTNFTDADVKVINGEKVPFSFDGPNAEGEYSIMVRPHEGSRQPIKVYVEAGAAADGAGNLSRASLVFVQPVDTDPPKIEQIAGVKGSYALGDTISIDVTFTEAVTLQLEPDLSQHVLPHLALNNGQEARYVAGSGGKTWTFEYVVSTPEDVTQLVDRETLKVLALVENDTSLLDAAGNKLEDYFVEASNQLNAGLSVDTTGAVITGFSSVDGTYKTDDVLYIRAHLSELVHVQGTPAPYLMLSNGGRATYLSGSGSSQLMFRYIVDEADGNASDLSVVSFNAPDAGILDRAGNVTDLGIVSGDNDLAAAHQIVVDTQAPELTGVRLVEDAGTASDVVNDGYYKAGTVLAFEVDFDDAVSVDVSGGTPILTLSNGSIAQYVGYVQVNDSGTMVDDPTKLRFEYTVLQDDINTRELKVTGLAERGAKIIDQAGNEALVSLTGLERSVGAVVDTVAPSLLSVLDDQPNVHSSISDVIEVRFVFDEPMSSSSLTEAGIILRDASGAVYGAPNGRLLDAPTASHAHEIVPGSLRQTSDREFAVNVRVADLVKGDLEVVVVADGSVQDLAGNSLVEDIVHVQPIDTLTTSFVITPVAGPFVGSDARVVLYRSDGIELTAGEDYRVDYDSETQDGLVQITLLSGYRGPMLIEVEDTSAAALDYQDELTKQQVSLDTKLRAMVVVDTPAPEVTPIELVVSPLTELAVRRAGIAVDSVPTDLSAEKVSYNALVADLFGLAGVDITRTPVTTTLDPGFDEADGLDASEAYGKVLATLSVKDSETGSVRNTIEGLVGSITEETDTDSGVVSLRFSAEAAEDIEQATNVVDLMQDTQDETLGADASAVANALRAVIRTAAGEEPFATQDELILLGVQGVDENTIGLATRLLRQTADDGSEVDSLAKIDALLSEALVALSTIASAAQTNTASTAVTHAHYSALGYADLDPAFEAALATVLDRPSVVAESVNSVAEIEALIGTYQNLFAYVVDPESAERVPSAADYTQLGIEDIDSIDGDALVAILNDALSTDRTLTGLVTDAAQLQGLVDDFNASMTSIRLYSEDPVVHAVHLPTFELYQKLRLNGISEGLVDSINSVLADADVVISANDVRNETQALVDAYTNLLDFAAADANAVAPTRKDYALLGVVQLTDSRAVDFATSLLPTQSPEQIDRVDTLSALADAINALLYTADITDVGTAAGDPSAITVEQLDLLGQSVTDAQLATVRAFIASKADTDVADIGLLNGLVHAVITAAERVKAYSEDPTAALDADNGGLGAPEALDYEVVLAGTGVSIAGVDAMNEILADPDVTVGVTDLQSELLELTTLYNTLVEMADAGFENGVDTLSLSDYQALGLNGLETLPDPDLSVGFLNTVMDVQGFARIDEAAELQAFADAVIALRDTVADGVAAVPGITVPQLQLLGIADASDANLTALQTVIARDAVKDYNNIAALADLQSVTSAVVTAINILSGHSTLDADAANNPNEAVYAQAGVEGVTEDNLLAVNAQLRLVALADGKDSLEELSALVTAGNDALAYVRDVVSSLTVAPATLAQGESGLTMTDQLAAYTAAGITGVTADNLLAVNAQITKQILEDVGLNDPVANLDSVSELQAKVGAANAALAYLVDTVQANTRAPINDATGGELLLADQLDAYTYAGVQGVSVDNVLAVNAQLRLETVAGNKDSVADVQAIVGLADAALDYIVSTIAPLNSTAVTNAAVQLAAYSAAGITGVTADNLLAVNAQIRKQQLADGNTDNLDTVADLQAQVVAADNALAYIISDVAVETGTDDAGTGTLTEQAQLDAYADAGVLNVTADNLLAVNAQLRKQQVADGNTDNLDSVADLQAQVVAADNALAYIISDVAVETGTDDAGTGTLTEQAQLDAYADAGVLNVTADNLLAVNAQIRKQQLADGNTDNLDTVADLQAQVVAADNALAYLVSDVQVETFALDDVTGTAAVLTTTEQLAAYAEAGVLNVTADNLLAVNAQLRLETTAANKDSVADIQTIVGLADGALDYLVNTVQANDTAEPFGSQAAGTLALEDQLAAYGAAGVRDVTVDNVLAVNAQLRLETVAGNKDSVSEVQAIVGLADAALDYIVSTIAPLNSTAVTNAAIQLAAYSAAGITGVTAGNLLAVNAQIRKQQAADGNTDNLETVSDIQAKVTAGNDALSTILTTIAPNTDTQVLEAQVQIDAYVDAGVLNVTAENLLAVNAQIRKQLTADSNATGNVDSVAELQAKVVSAEAALTYLISDVQAETYALDDVSGGEAVLTTTEQLTAYADAGVLNVTADNLLAVNAQMRLETTAANKDSVADIQTIVGLADDAIALIEEYNRGDGSTPLDNAATTLTPADYAAAGIRGVTADNQVAVNQVILAANAGEADQVGEIQSLVNTGIQAQLDALAKIAAFAETLATSVETVAGDEDNQATLTLTVPQSVANAGYTLKVGNVILETGALDGDPSVAEFIAALQLDGAYTLAPFTVAAHSTNVNDIVIKFKNVGERTVVAELRSAMPTIVDYENSGATGADAENLYAINDGLMARTKTQADSTVEVQSLLNAAQTVYTTNLDKVLEYAEGTNTVKPSVRTYKLAGLTAVTEASLSAVNKIVEAEDDTTINDFVTAEAYVNNGVQAYEAALLKLANYANEEANAATPDLTDYETAGIAGLQAGDIDMINALMIQRETETDGLATTTTGIQSIVNQGLAAIFKIRDAAENNTAVSGSLTVDDYTAVGIDANDIVDVDALNSALDSQPVNGVIARSFTSLSEVVTAVKNLLINADGGNAGADGVALTADDLIAMGVSGLVATTGEPTKQAAAIAIFNDLIDTKADADVDTVAKTQALYDAVGAVLRTASGDTPMVTKVQLGLLGFDVDDAGITTDVTDNNLSAIQQVLINLNLDADFTNLTSLAQLQTLTNNAISALNALEAAAQGDDASAITATTTFSDMGVTTVTSVGETAGTANNLAAIKTVLASTAITGSDADTYEDVKALVDSYNVLFAYAEGGSSEPELSDYQALGLSDITTADQLALMNSLIATTADASLIDTAAKLQAKATAVAHILSTTEVTDVDGIDAAITAGTFDDDLTTTDLEALGFTYDASSTLVSGGSALPEITDKNLDSIRLAVANTADDHSDVLDYTALKTLVEDTAKAANTIQAYGAADSSSATPVPTADDYTAIGVKGVTDANVAAINSSLAEANVLDTITASVAAEAQDIVNTWAKVQALADGEVDTVAVSAATATLTPASSTAEVIGPMVFNYTALNSGNNASDHPSSFVIEGRNAGGQWTTVKTLNKVNADILPAFTASTTSGYTITANGQTHDGDNRAPWRAADNNIRTTSGNADDGWVSNTQPGTLTVTLPEARVVHAYTLTSSGHHDGFPERWNFQGRDYKGTWVTLDSRTGVDATSAGQSFTFYVDKSGSYDAYRFTDVRAPAGNEIVLGEIGFWGYAESVSSSAEFEEYQVKVSDNVVDYASYEAPSVAVSASQAFDANASTAWLLPSYSDEGYAYVDLGSVKAFETIKVELPTGNNAPATIEIYGSDSPINLDNIGAADLLANQSIDTAQLVASSISGQGIFAITPETKFSHRYIAVKVIGDGVYQPKINEISLSNTETSYTVYTSDADSDGFVGEFDDIKLLTSTEFASLGVKSRDGISALSADATKLLNQLIDERGLSAVDNTAEIKALAAAVEALLATAAINWDGTGSAPDAANGDITQTQLNLLGLSLIDGNNYAGIISYLKGAGGNDYATLDHIAKIRANLISAITGLSEIEKAAELNNATDTYPLAAHWDVINSLTPEVSSDEVASEDVDSFNSMLNSQVVDGLAAQNTTDLLSRITLYNEVLTAATSGGTAAALTQSEYESIGVTGFSATATRATAEVAVLNQVISSITDNTKVDRVTEVVDIRKAVSALIDTVEGKTPAITKSQLGLLGFAVDDAGVTTDVTDDNLSAIRKVLADTGIGTDYDTVNTLAKIQTLVSGAINALEAVKTEAEDNDGGSSITVAELEAMGVEGAVDTGSGANIALINSILDGSVGSTAANTLEKVQKLVDVAVKVVDLAGDASAAKLTQAELTLIGVTGVNSATKLALVNDLLVADSTAQAALSDIQTFADVAAKVITNLELATSATFTDANALTAAELVTLGFTQDTGTPRTLVSSGAATASVNEENLGLIRLAIASSGSSTDDSAVNRLSKITTLVTTTATAANKVANFADATSTPTDAGLIPTVADFEAILVTGVDSTNLASVLDALAQSGVTVSSSIQTKVQAVVDSYNEILAAADGADNSSGAPIETDFTGLGVTLSTDSAALKAAQVSILADIVDIKSAIDVDTVAELQAIADAVKSVLDTASMLTTTDFSVADNGVTVAELELLGIARVTNDNLASVRLILANEATTQGDLDTLNSLSEIQALIANVVNALDVITAYAADHSNPIPSVQTYMFAGVQGVTEDNLEAVNRQVDAAERSDVDTVAKLETVVNAGLAAHLAVVNKIAEYSNALVTATSIESGDSTFAADGTRTDATPAQQSLALSGLTLTSDDVLTLRVGTTTLASDPLAGTTAADLLAALQASANYSDAPFTVSLNGDSTALLLDWKVWGEVSDTATLRSAQPSLDDYLLAGLQIAGRTNDGVTAETLYAVSASVEAATLTVVADDATVTQVKALLDSVETEVDAGILAKTTAFTKIETFADDAGVNAPAPTVADYALANIAGVTADNLLAVNTRLKAGNSTPGDALTEAQIEAAVADADTRLARFGNNTPVAPATAFTKADYEAIGITGVSDTVVDSANSIDGTDNLLAVNAQIARAAGHDANSSLDIQWAVARANAAIASIEAYNNGTLGRELTIDDYIAVGINGVVPNDIHSINEAVASNSTLVLNSVSDIQGLVDSGKRSLQSAIAAIYQTSQSETPEITIEQLKTLGFSSVTDAEITTSSLSSIHKVMADYYRSDPSYLNSVAQAVSKTESLARTAIDALDAIKANAAANTSTDDTTDTGLDAGTAGLDAADFVAMGVTTVTDSGSGSANNLSMVLSVLDSTAIAATEVTTYEQVQAIVDSVNTILTYVETGATAPKISDFTTLGLADIATVDQLTLINSYLNDSNTAVTDIDSYDELQARLTAVNHILADAAITDLTSGQGIDDVTATYVTTFADLEALGFTYVDTSTTAAKLVNAGQATMEVTPENIDSIRLALANSANDLSELQSFSALKTLIEDTAKAANTIQAFGAGLTGAHVPAVADYAAIGVTGVTSLNLDAINSSLAEAGVLDTITSSVAVEVQDIVDTWAKVSALADGQNNVTTSGSEKPTASEWASLGLVLGDGVEEQVASLLGDILDPKVFADVQALDKLQSYVDALNALIQTTSLDYDSSTQTSVGTPDEGNGERADGSNAYITYAQLKLLGLGALDDAPRTINGISSTSSRYDDALEFVADGSAPLNNDWEGYKGALISSISGLSKLEKVASLNSAVVANISTPNYTDYTAVGNFNPWGSQTGTVTLTNNWRDETLNRYQLISQTNDRWSFYRYQVNGSWTTWYRFDYVRNENGTVSGGWTSRGMSGNHNTWTPQFVNGRTDWYHNNLNVTVSVSINQSNIDAVKVLNSVLNTESIEDADTENLKTSLTIYRQILSAANGIAGTQLVLTADQYASLGIVGLEETGSQSARQTAKLAILNEVIDGLAKTTVDTIPGLQKVFDAVDALIRTIEGELPAITAAELSLLKFTGVNANNLSAIQKVLSDVDISSNYDAVDTLTKVKAIVSNAVAALEVLKSEAAANDSDSITVALLEDMGVEGAVDTGAADANIALINSALDTLAIAAVNVDTLEEVQALVNVAAKVVALAGDASAPKLVASDLVKLGVDLTALDSGNIQANAIAMLNDLIIADSTAQTAVADIQTWVTALGALIDDVAEATAASLDLTGAELEALGFDATSTNLVSGPAPTANITTNNIQAIRLALSATADDLSDLPSLSALQTLVNETAKAANKIGNYVEATITPTDAGLIPTVADFAAIGVTGVETNNLSAILNDLSQATSINNITADAQSIVSNHNQLGLDANAFISNIYVGFDGEEVVDSGVFYEDETPDIVLYLDSFTESDTIQLIVDGSEVNLGAPSADDIASGELIINNFNIATYDIDQNDAVRLQVQVSHNDGSVSLSDEKDYFFG